MSSAAGHGVTVTVKWGKLEYKVPVDVNGSVLEFKASLYSLTNVPPERQRLMCKAWKGVLKDDASLAGLLDGAIVSMMGSADVTSKPLQQTVRPVAGHIQYCACTTSARSCATSDANFLLCTPV